METLRKQLMNPNGNTEIVEYLFIIVCRFLNLADRESLEEHYDIID
jgi:hypothetical protein